MELKNQMDIFEENKLYPNEEDSLLKHYLGYFDNIFIGLIPFFIVPGYSVKGDFPKNEDIAENGIAVSWTQIIDNTEIKTFKDLNRTLMTSIGALKPNLERKDLIDKLYDYTTVKNIWDPSEGTFDVFTKTKIYKLCKSYNLNSLIIQSEFYEETKKINLNDLTSNEFINSVKYNDYYIFSIDKEILFTISWDYYFFFVAIKSDIINKANIEKSFEGFWANKSDSHSWAWEENIKGRQQDNLG